MCVCVCMFVCVYVCICVSEVLISPCLCAISAKLAALRQQCVRLCVYEHIELCVCISQCVIVCVSLLCKRVLHVYAW